MTDQQNKSPPQHTPGPWAYEMSNGEIFLEDAYRVFPRIAKVDLSNCESVDQTDADGFLIAAAPELLEALIRWQQFAKNNGWTDKDHHDADGKGWITLTDAAIAKARGQQ